ncbi:hypothetical protein KM043_004647 [Ampulex compressa]|nr:hypothetical protein KM043_004647 [Ampulex compressa]
MSVIKVGKSLINDVDNAVEESLSGLCYTYPHLVYHKSHKVILSSDYKDRGNVAVVCGGGSGHEPFAAGFVGNGMLTASIAGSIFAAPPSVHIFHALQCVSEKNEAGVLVIVPNYTGDCLNFGIAIEKARQQGLKVSEIIVGEDCSIPAEEQSSIGKRGLTGLLFVIKIAGALAERGAPLLEVTKTAHDVSRCMATYAVGLTPCSIPGQGLMFELSNDEIECGMGIHGEAGYEKVKLGTANEVVASMLKRISDALLLKAGDCVAVIVNNFGTLSQLEQGIVVHEVASQLEKANVRPLRVYSGILMTSLNSAGIHITILKLHEDHKDLFLSCLDAPTDAPRWPGCAYSLPATIYHPPCQAIEKKTMDKVGLQMTEREQLLFVLCLKSASAAIIKEETRLNELDRGCGDGDCGTTLRRLAEGIMENLNSFHFSHPSTVLDAIGQIAEERMGGSSGALYCLFFTTGAKELALIEDKADWRIVWARTFRSGLDCLVKYGKAQPGDRTMIDAMNAACTAYEKLLAVNAKGMYEQIAAAAWKGCEATKCMKPRAGRASYVKQSQYLQEADAGAYAAATWINAVVQTITGDNN